MTLTRARLLMEDGEAAAREDELAALQDEIVLLSEELRIKDDRMARLVACRRPHYRPMSRVAILELRRLRGLSQLANRLENHSAIEFVRRTFAHRLGRAPPRAPPPPRGGSRDPAKRRRLGRFHR